jgi:hypothetical protein
MAPGGSSAGGKVTREPDLPEAWIRGEGTVERLFPDFERAERDYYTKSKIAIMPDYHQDGYSKHDPWVATSL